MDKDDITFKLKLNLPIEIDGVRKFAVPVLRTVVEWGEARYNEAISALLFDKSQHEAFIPFHEDNYAVMCLLFESDQRYRRALDDAFLLLFKSSLQLQRREEGASFYIEVEQEKRLISREQMESIRQVVRIAHFIEEKKLEYKPANNAAQKMIELINRNKRDRPSRKTATNLQSIVSGIAWKSGSINLLNITDLTIYQIYDGYYRLHTIDDCNHTFTGIYSGAIDSKKIKLSEINWAAIPN